MLADVEVHEFLDAIVDEIRITDDENEDNLNSQSKTHAKTPTASEKNQSMNVPIVVVEPTEPPRIPRLSVSNHFNNEIQQYLYGYGDNYGEQSSNDLEQADNKTKQRFKEIDMNSVEVLTSLNSSQSDGHDDDSMGEDPQLPMEVESLLDGVQRMHSSLEHEKPIEKVSFTK